MSGRGIIGRFLLFWCLGVTGCYHYVPLDPGFTKQGHPVQVRLKEPASFPVGDLTVHNVVLVRGEIVRREGSDFVLSAFWMESSSGVEYPGEGRTIRIREEATISVEGKEFSRLRSGAMTLTGLLFSWVFFRAVQGDAGEPGSAGGGGRAQ